MTTETQTPPASTPAPQSQEETQRNVQESNDAFSAGFNDEAPAVTPAAGDPTKKESTPTPAAPAATPAATPAAATPTGETPPAPEQKIAGFTETELKRLLSGAQLSEQERTRFERQFKQINGWIGNINAQLLKLAKPASAAPAAGSTPRELNSEAMKKLKDDLPDVHQAIMDALALMPSTGAGGPSKEELEQLVQGRVADAVGAFQAEQQRREQGRLFKAHPELKEFAAKAPKGTSLLDLWPDFKLWFNAQPPEYRAEIIEAEDAATVSDAFSKFKESRKATTDEATRKREEEERLKRERQNTRLESAVTPQGVPESGPQQESAEAAFLAGFNTG